MTRVLRYPRMSAILCALTLGCALARDYCISAALYAYSLPLLYATIVLLAGCFMLMSCRFFVDDDGVGVGFLLHVRRTSWQDIASFGILYCNSKRRYLYGMYRGNTDFLNLLHHAPVCGQWGFIVPLGRKLLTAVCHYCPFEMDLSPIPSQQRKGRLRRQWHQALLYTLVMPPSAAVAFITGGLVFLRASQIHEHASVMLLVCCTLFLFGVGAALIYRAVNTFMTCPAFNEEGVCAGGSLYLDWENVRFCYVHRIAQLSGMFMLSRPHYEMQRRGAPPVVCLSMPDTTTLLLAYLTYCPHVEKGESQNRLNA